MRLISAGTINKRRIDVMSDVLNDIQSMLARCQDRCAGHGKDPTMCAATGLESLSLALDSVDLLGSLTPPYKGLSLKRLIDSLRKMKISRDENRYGDHDCAFAKVEEYIKRELPELGMELRGLDIGSSEWEHD